MTRFALAMLMASTLGLASATGQTTDTPSLDEGTPADNVRGAALRARAPGNIVQDALARHAALRDARLEYQRSGGEINPNGTLNDGAGTGSIGTGGGTGSGVFGGLLDGLLGSNLLGGIGGLGDLSGLLGGSSGGTGGDSAIPSNITPEVIALLEQFGIDINDVFPAGGTSKVNNAGTGFNGFVTTDKTSTFQGVTPPVTEEPKFHVRWANAVLGSIFTALETGIRLNAFVDLLENIFRPLLIPESQDQTSKPASVRLSPAPPVWMSPTG